MFALQMSTSDPLFWIMIFIAIMFLVMAVSVVGMSSLFGLPEIKGRWHKCMEFKLQLVWRATARPDSLKAELHAFMHALGSRRQLRVGR